MQSGKSFFNAAIYQKTLLRCWPIWLIYIGLWLVILPMDLLNMLEQGRHLWVQQHVLESATQAGVYISFVACATVAMVVFGWMYSIKNVSFTASLPVSRRAHYLTALAAGLTVLLGSNVVVVGITALVESIYGGLDMAALWQWLGWVSLLDIHFFGFAACCAMLTGHLLILPAVYVIFQLMAVTIQGTAAYILEHMIWGLDYGQWSLSFLSPIWTLPGIYPDAIRDTVTGDTLRYTLQQWPLLLCYAGAGILLAGLGWQLFKKRRMEAATDVVAIGILKPVFRWCLALAGSLGFGGLLVTVVYASRSGGGNMTDALFILAAMACGGLVGWFLADILMRKSLRVFTLHWKGALLYTAILSLVVLGAELDITGYEKNMPNPDKVEQVYLSCSEGWVEFDDPENIALVMALNESLIRNRDLHEQRNAEEGWYRNLYLSYRDGNRLTVLNRSYELLITDELAAAMDSDVMQLERLLNTKEAISERKETRIPIAVDTIENAHISNDYTYDEDSFLLELTPEEAYELYTEYILPDIEEGTLGRVWVVADEEYEKTVYNLQIHLSLQQEQPGRMSYTPITRDAPPTFEQAKNEILYEYDYFSTTPTVDSWRTNAWLSYHGVPMETLWELYNKTP